MFLSRCYNRVYGSEHLLRLGTNTILAKHLQREPMGLKHVSSLHDMQRTSMLSLVCCRPNMDHNVCLIVSKLLQDCYQKRTRNHLSVGLHMDLLGSSQCSSGLTSWISGGDPKDRVGTQRERRDGRGRRGKRAM